jgi:hypothetical protein
MKWFATYLLCACCLYVCAMWLLSKQAWTAGRGKPPPGGPMSDMTGLHHQASGSPAPEANKGFKARPLPRCVGVWCGVVWCGVVWLAREGTVLLSW